MGGLWQAQGGLPQHSALDPKLPRASQYGRADAAGAVRVRLAGRGYRHDAVIISISPDTSRLYRCRTKRFERFLGMSVPDKGSYFSRFTMKFVEIVAASVATAVGGALVAHLGGYLAWPGASSPPTPTPAAIQASPNAGVVPKTQAAQPTPPAPAAGDAAGERHPASAQEVGPAAVQPAHGNASQAAPSHKHMITGRSAGESKPREAEGRNAGENKPREAESVEARVRAALEKVDANRPAPAEIAPQKVDLKPELPAVPVQPRPVEAALPGPSAVAPPPPAADVAPRAAEAVPAPVQQAPPQPEPLTPVEIKSRPVAAVEASPQPEPASPAHEENKGILSTLEKIPQMLRPASGATSADPPRPPLPVGQ